MANEKRLIDANALKEQLNKLEAHGGHNYYRKGMDDALHTFMPHFIDDAPTVDAVEVVHGEWEITEDDYLSLVEMKCSVCGESYGFEFFEDVTPRNYHYCPNCGAKMDGDGNGQAVCQGNNAR